MFFENRKWLSLIITAGARSIATCMCNLRFIAHTTMTRSESRGRDARSRAWCFTWFGYTDVEEPQTWIDVRYLVYQEEVCPTTQREHLQGYVYFDRLKDFDYVKSLDDRVSWRKARGNALSNKKYCSDPAKRKPGGFAGEFGIMPQQGRRTDLIDAKAALDSSMSMKDVSQEHFEASVKYHKGFEWYRRLQAKAREETTSLYIIYGPPGTGKSFYVRERGDVFCKDNSMGPWWDGYEGQANVLLDEFDWCQWSYKLILRLADSGQLIVPVKGGSREFVSTAIYIVCNDSPEGWWPNVDKTALLRRITGLWWFGKRGRYSFMGDPVPPLVTSVMEALPVSNTGFPEEMRDFAGVDNVIEDPMGLMEMEEVLSTPSTEPIHYVTEASDDELTDTDRALIQSIVHVGSDDDEVLETVE